MQYSENPTGENIEVFLAKLENAQIDGPAWGFLAKSKDATTNILKLGDGAFNSIKTLGSRAVFHSNRLLEPGRSEVERNFAVALAKNAEAIMTLIGEEDKEAIRATISGEGSDCCLWLTLSPYVFDELKLQVEEEKALNEVIEWAKTGIVKSEIEDKEVNLSGLNTYNYARFNQCTFTLGRDPNGNSHLFARQEAQRLIREVFQPPK